MFRILYLGGVSKLIHYFDANGAQIFQNTLFRGVQTFIIILMCRVHTYFRVLYLGGVQTFIIILMSGDFKDYPLCAIVFFFAFF